MRVPHPRADESHFFDGRLTPAGVVGKPGYLVPQSQMVLRTGLQ
jgi:hypothetical protein